MPRWSDEEIQKAASLIGAIGECRAPRRQRRSVPAIDLSLRAAIPLLDGLGGGTRALVVRQLLQALGFDEHNHVEWRLEHKLVQALVLNFYLPGLVPVTLGLMGALAGRDFAEFRSFLAAEFPDGYLVKTALGDSSGEGVVRPSLDDIMEKLPNPGSPTPDQLIDETYIIQAKVPILLEYRVHSLEEQVIDDLTFRRYGGGSIPGERDGPNAFVQSMLDRLPDAIVGGSLLAWDVALMPNAEYAIIEVNFSGFHPVFKRGFHCSGYYHDYNWGSCDTARLLNHVARVDGVEVRVHADAPEYPDENRFYADVAAWQERHKATRVPAARWEPEEARQISSLLREMDDFAALRRRPPLNSEIELRLSNAIPLLHGLAASTRALLTRQILLTLGFDERRLGEWRLEHKLVQAHILHHYAPGTIPVTCGLDRLISFTRRQHLRQFLRLRFPAGFVLKTALGDSSGDHSEYRTEAALSWIESGGRSTPDPGPLTGEEFIVQQLVRIRREYRVHTVEDDVIDDLTVRRHHGAVGTGERSGPNSFVRSILDALPAGITSGALLAWDVALAEDGTFSVIEINVGGFHTVYNPGFHSSGYYHHKHYGCVYTARLIRFVERTYDCRIRVIADAPDHPDENWFYREVEDWKACF